MTRLRKLTVILLLVLLFVAAIAPAAAKVTMQDFHFAVAGDPSQWGSAAEYSGGTGKVTMQDFHLVGDPSQWGLSRKVNEYEGQH